MSYKIYAHINKINGKIYIGQTCRKNVNQRWRNGRGYINNVAFYRAIQKYGWDNCQKKRPMKKKQNLLLYMTLRTPNMDIT